MFFFLNIFFYVVFLGVICFNEGVLMVDMIILFYVNWKFVDVVFNWGFGISLRVGVFFVI